MDVRKLRFTRVAAAVVAVLTLAACGTTQQAEPSDKQAEPAPAPSGPISVVASINQWGSLAQEIGGDDVEVSSVLGSTAVDAHDFEPKTSDLTALSKADVVVVNGAGYDSWATKVLSKDSTLVSAADMVGAVEGDNPHLWFSKDARADMAQALADAFSKARPKKAKAFASRLEDWQEKQKRVTDWMADFAKDHKDLTYAATEPVAHYLMSDLGLSDVTPKGYAQAMASGGEVAPADLQDFQQVIEGREAKLLVNNPQEAPDATNMLTGTAGRSDVPVLDVTEQMPSDAGSLTAWIESLIDALVEDVDPGYGTPSSPAEDDTDGESDSQMPSNEGQTDPGATPSNEGQTDPGAVPSNEGQTDPGR